MEILKGGPVAKKITESLHEKVLKFSRVPKLAIVRLSDDEGAISYESGAVKRMEKVGIQTEVKVYPENVIPETFYEEFGNLNRDPEIDGILLIKPFPKSIDEEKVKEILDPEKDVDCFTKEGRLALLEDRELAKPCTPEGVMALLDHYEIPIAGKEAVVIGRSLVVGKPLALMLLKRNATVTICHSKTADLKSVCKRADILISAIGRAKMIDASYVKEGATVIDVGINVDAEGNLCGDVNFDSISDIAGAATPVPGGVGNVTTSILASHVIENFERKANLL